jgi:hypothetical protein
MALDDFDFPAEHREAPPERQRAPEVEPLPWPPTPNSPASAPARTPAPLAVVRPAPSSPTAARAKAGLGIIAAAAGVGLGAVLAGPLGAVAGLAGIGTVRNLYRSQGIASSDPAEQSDAARSLAIGVVGLGIVGFLGYKIWNSNKDRD